MHVTPRDTACFPGGLGTKRDTSAVGLGNVEAWGAGGFLESEGWLAGWDGNSEPVDHCRFRFRLTL